MRFAKESGTAVIVVGHVTKGGGIAGPKTLEHIVDTVLYFEGEATLDYRLLRTTKNRFGSVDELGVFSMTEHGLIAVPNPSAVFLAARADGISGSAVTALMEGTRPVLVEVQALAAKSGYGTPQRVATGLDPKRLAVLLAVLERRAETSFADLDVFVQVTAGVRLSEPGADLAVAAALLSSLYNRPAPRGRASSSARSASAARSGPAGPSSGASPRRRGSASAACSARRGAGRRSPGSRWSGSTTSSSWCGRLPRDVGVVVVAAGRGTRLGGGDAQAVPADRRRADGAARGAAVRRPPRRRRRSCSSCRRTTPTPPPAFLRRIAGAGLWWSWPAGASARDSVAAGLRALGPNAASCWCTTAARPVRRSAR